MTIEDAWGILKGNPDAATQYLKRTTSPQIKEKFKPIIQNSLDKVSANPIRGWSTTPATWTEDFGLRMFQSAASQNWAPANGCPY